MEENGLIPHPPLFRLLIADDHIHIRETLALWVKSLYPDIQILLAENGARAIQICQSCPVNLILVDLKMPDLDGCETTRRIKQSCPQVPVFLMSIHDSDVYHQEALLAGADGFLSKNKIDMELPLVLMQFISRKEI